MINPSWESKKYNIKLYCGDCLEVMPELEFADTCITDPPYGISFMGKEWDHGVPGKLFWEALQLKPGSLLLAFGGTRTFHRLTCAIEDAGFEIRDCLMWLYGCLSEDTEVLTLNGWEHYHKDIINSPVLCYDIETDQFMFHKPTKDYFYENQHPAYRIYSDHTDQIVSRNHRCIIEQKGNFVFKTPETWESEENIPFLESLHDLPETIPNSYSGTSITKQNLFKRMQKQESFSIKYRQKNSSRKKKNCQNNLPSVWKRIFPGRFSFETCKNSNMFKKMRRILSWTRMEVTCLQRTSSVDRKKYKLVQRKNVWRKKSCMERWSYIFSDTWKLFTNKVCKMSKRIYFNVEKGWLCYGTPFNHGTTFNQSVIANRSGSSYQSQSSRQQNRKFDVVSRQQGAQIVRRTRAKIEEIEYNGYMWCIEVPTHAFVARRNGKIFITGNSGFPKSHNISKGIDKKLGETRNKIVLSYSKCRNPKSTGSGRDGMEGATRPWIENAKINGFHEMDDDTPISEDANIWNGWGTSLKPAWEPIILAMKSLEGSYADNALKHGVAGMWIDGSRIHTAGSEGKEYTVKRLKSGATLEKTGGNWRPETGEEFHGKTKDGRWPANVIHDGSEEVVSGFPNSKGWSDQNHNNFNPYGGNSLNNSETIRDGHFEGYNDDGSASRFFKECSEKTPYIYSGNTYNVEGFVKECKPQAPSNYNDKGSPSRYFYCAKTSKKERTMNKTIKNDHPTVKPQALMEYLCTLTKTPTNGIVIDPFMGSGSTGLACLTTKRGFLGIERNPEYFNIAVKRIEAQIKEMESITSLESFLE